MKKIKRKLHSREGETIVEALSAILIGSLSCAMLAGSVTSAVNVNRNAQRLQGKFYEELKTAERGPGNSIVPNVQDGTVTIQVTGGGVYTYDVRYVGGEGKLTSYQLKTLPTELPGGGGGAGGS